MSEQRFTIQKASGMYLHLPILDNGVEMADGDVCILLNEQQSTINNYRTSRDKWRTKCHQTKEKLDYWKHKSLELYKLLRKINLSDMEWEEFLNIINEKELFDDE